MRSEGMVDVALENRLHSWHPVTQQLPIQVASTAEEEDLVLRRLFGCVEEASALMYARADHRAKITQFPSSARQFLRTPGKNCTSLRHDRP